jgi:hypothetical protein
LTLQSLSEIEDWLGLLSKKTNNFRQVLKPSQIEFLVGLQSFLHMIISISFPIGTSSPVAFYFANRAMPNLMKIFEHIKLLFSYQAPQDAALSAQSQQ